MHLGQNSTAQNADGTINFFMRLTWVDLCKLLQPFTRLSDFVRTFTKSCACSAPCQPYRQHHTTQTPVLSPRKSGQLLLVIVPDPVLSFTHTKRVHDVPGAVPPCTPNSQHHACAQYVLSTCTAGFVYRIFVPETPNKSIPGTLERPKPTRNRHKTDTIYRGSAQSTLLSGHCDEWCTIVS